MPVCLFLSLSLSCLIFFLFRLTPTDHVYRLWTIPTSSAALSLATGSLSPSASATAASAPLSTPHGHAHLHTLDHAYPIVYGHAHRYAHSHSHGGYTTLAPKSAMGGSPNRKGNMGVISGSTPVLRPRSRGWIRCARAGRRVRVILQGQWRGKEEQNRGAGGGKGENVSNPIPVVGGKMKR